MKKFLTQMAFLALVVALGYLGWRNSELLRQNAALRDTVRLLEQERRELQTKSAPKPAGQIVTRAEIEQQTAALRGLSFKKPVHYKVIGRDELRRVIETKLAEQYDDQQLRDYGRTLETIGLIPEGTHLRDVIVGLYDEQVAAFYVPEERALYTFTDLSLDDNLDRVTLAHELTHALQDQNYDLTTFPLRVTDNDDLALATAALVEGDATLVMAQYYGENLDVRNMLQDVLGAMLGQNTAKFQAAPAYLRDSLLFPYQHGAEFAMAVFANGGTDALNTAFEHPPVSTKQILHPGKFLHDRQDPEKIELKKLDVAGWRLIGSNVAGEFGLRTLFAQHFGVLEAQRLAAGWNGDRYQVYERGTNGPTALVWTTAWETEQAAADFAEAYRRMAEKRGVVAKVEQTATRVRLRQAKTAGALDELK
jgi:hypothetical protein